MNNDLLEELSKLDIQQLGPEHDLAVIGMVVLLGVLYCFAGYRLLRLVLLLTGFVMAGMVAGLIAGVVAEGRFVFIAAAACVGGIAGAFALLVVYRVGVVCLGLLGGLLLADSVLGGRPEAWAPSAVLGFTVFVGLSSLVFERAIVTVATSAIGGWMAAHGVALFVSTTASDEHLEQLMRADTLRVVMLICWGVLAFAGVVTQFATYRAPAQSTGR